MFTKKSEQSQFVIVPMKCLIDSNTDRPELVMMSERLNTYGDQDITGNDESHVFHIQYVPFTYCSKELQGILSCLKKRFNDTGDEYKVMDNVFNDERTQALSIGFRDDDLKTGTQHFIVISTIIFRIVWDDKYKDQFIFIYYRATDNRPLSERQINKDGLFSDYKKIWTIMDLVVSLLY